MAASGRKSHLAKFYHQRPESTRIGEIFGAARLVPVRRIDLGDSTLRWPTCPGVGSHTVVAAWIVGGPVGTIQTYEPVN